MVYHEDETNDNMMVYHEDETSDNGLCIMKMRPMTTDGV